MKTIKLSMRTLNRFQTYLYEEERSQATIDKYMRDVKAFYEYLPEDKEVTKENLLTYKQFLIEKEYKITSMNSMIVAINCLLIFLNVPKLRLKLYKIQKTVFYSYDKELTKNEYKRLLAAARSNERLYLLIQTICGTGIRVSEHRYITVQSLHSGQAFVNNKGKTRIIFIPPKLRNMLLSYCKRQNIKSGAVFITKSGKPMDRSNIWVAMKKLCENAHVDNAKVFPHNLRHLFALTYYRLHKDVVRLADILGHSSIETTRIYTMIDGKECQKFIAKMELVSLSY